MYTQTNKQTHIFAQALLLKQQRQTCSRRRRRLLFCAISARSPSSAHFKIFTRRLFRHGTSAAAAGASQRQ